MKNLALFFAIDSSNFRRHKTAPAKLTSDRIELAGSHNFLWLFVIIALVLAQKAEWLKGVEHWSAMASLGDALGWTAGRTAECFIMLLIALLMIGTASLSYRFANQGALKENRFSFAPLREVGFLFVGIFATMVPALDLLEKHAADIGITTVRQFYWGSGLLSAMLDNAPTYLNFLTAAFGLQGLSLENPAHVDLMLHGKAHAALYVIAVSLGSVFFGAVSYIGNGPNFMVKSIAESAGVKCPSFFGYVFKYALPILIPLLAIVSWLFLR